MKIRALVQNKVLLILVDSGSSNTFINKSFVEMMGIPTVPMAPKKVRLANGNTLISGQCGFLS